MTNTEGGSVDLDVKLSKRANEETDIEKLIEEFQEVLKAACDKSFRKQRITMKTITNKSVPWWTDELTVMRKRTNALRRRYHETSRMGAPYIYDISRLRVNVASCMLPHLLCNATHTLFTL